MSVLSLVLSHVALCFLNMCLKGIVLFFLYTRFLGYAENHESLRVSLEDIGNLHVDFFKWLDEKERKDSENICTVFIIPRSPGQVFFILLFNCIHLHLCIQENTKGVDQYSLN